MSMFTAMPTAGAASITRAVPTTGARLSSTAMTSSVVTPAPIAAVIATEIDGSLVPSAMSARGEVVPRAPEEIDVTERERPNDLLVAHALVLRRSAPSVFVVDSTRCEGHRITCRHAGGLAGTAIDLHHVSKQDRSRW